MNNLPIQTYESVVQQRDEMEKKLADVVAENVALKDSHPQPFGSEMMMAIDAYEKYQNEVPEKGMLNAFFILRNSIRVETPVTDEFTRELMAKGVEDAASSLFGAGYSFDLLMAYADKLRKGINDAQ